jgi:hypothetical protein
MREFTSSEDAVTWLNAQENRVLAIRAPQHSSCEEYFLGEFTQWTQTKTNWQFAFINENSFTGYPGSLGANRHILGMAAPFPTEYLTSLIN